MYINIKKNNRILFVYGVRTSHQEGLQQQIVQTRNMNDFEKKKKKGISKNIYNEFWNYFSYNITEIFMRECVFFRVKRDQTCD